MKSDGSSPAGVSALDGAMYHALFEAAPGLYVALQPDGPRFTIAAASDAFLAAARTTRGELVGRGLFDVLADDGAVQEALERVLAARASVRLPVHRADLRLPDGSTVARSWTATATPLLDGAGEVRLVLHALEDVTDTSERPPHGSTTEARLALLLSSIRDYAVFMLDPRGCVATWNPGAERIKRYRADEIIGRHFSVFYPEEDVRDGKCEMELAEASRTGRFEDEGWRVRKDGSRFWANVIINAVRDESGRLVGFSKVTRDLTERKHAEEERVRLAQAQEAVRMRDEFLSIASHELRTPLTSLQLQLSGLQRSLRRGLPPVDKLAARLEVADQQVRRLNKLIHELLDVSRATAGRIDLTLEDVDLAQVIRDALERLRGDLGAAHCAVRVDVESPLVGRWDRLRLDQIITNFLTNALKYGAGRPIAIAARRSGGRAVVTVTDHGIGISPDDQQRIFERFSRAVTADHYGGLGLGLWIVREFVHAMGGTVSVESEVGRGATFRAELPLAATSDQPSAP